MTLGPWADDTHLPYREWIGDYVLGDLDAPLTSRLEEHLAICARCTAEVGELRAVVGELSAAEVGVVAELPQPSPALQGRVLAAVRAERRRAARRVWSLPLAAGLAAAVAGIVAVVVLLPRAPAAPPQEQVAGVVALAGVTAEAALVNHTWGVEVKLVVTGLAAGEEYAVAVETLDGGRVGAGSFVGVADVPIRCNLNASVLRPDAAGFTVTDAAGEVVVTADLPPPA